MHTEISDRKPSTALMDTAEYNLRLQVPYSTSTNGSRQTVPIIPPSTARPRAPGANLQDSAFILPESSISDIGPPSSDYYVHVCML